MAVITRKQSNIGKAPLWNFQRIFFSARGALLDFFPSGGAGAMRCLVCVLGTLLVAGCVSTASQRPTPVHPPETPALVSEVQSRLNAKGYNAGPVDGVAGLRTRDAIRRFEATNNLPVDGAIDDAFLVVLRKDGGRAPARAVTPAAAPAAPTAPAASKGPPVPSESKPALAIENASAAGVTLTGDLNDEAVASRMADEHCAKFDKAAQVSSTEGNRRRYNCVSF